MAEAAERNDVQGVIEHSEGFHRLIVEATTTGCSRRCGAASASPTTPR